MIPRKWKIFFVHSSAMLFIACFFIAKQTEATGNPVFERNITYTVGFGAEDKVSLGLGPNDTPIHHIDEEGNMYIIDNPKIKKINAAGQLVLEFGSTGSGNGQFGSAPRGLVVNASGTIFVSDHENERIQLFDSSGNYISEITHTEPALDLDGVSSIDVATSGEIYVVARDDDKVLKFDATGNFLTEWGGTGSGNGQFNSPGALAIDSGGNIYVADSNNHRVQKFDANGNYLSQFGTQGSSTGQLNGVFGIDVDSSGNIYVADTNNNRIQKFDSSGNFLFATGTVGSSAGQFNAPLGIAADGSGNIYVADTNNNRIQKLDSSGNFIVTYGGGGAGDGFLAAPSGIEIDNDGNIYIADANNHRVQKFNSSGVYVSKFGTLGSGNGQFNVTRDVALDSDGNIYIADFFNDRFQKFDENGVFLSKVIKHGESIMRPFGLTLDANGNLLVAVADITTYNHGVFRMTPSGTLLNKYGTYGTSNGEFSNPSGIAVDQTGNIYVSETTNQRVQKLDASGNYILKFGSFGSGNGQFSSPYALRVDSLGNIYVVDTFNSRVQKFDSSGNFTLAFGSSGSADGQFTNPQGIVISTSSHIYIAAGKRIQRFDTSGNFVSKWSPGSILSSQRFNAYKSAGDANGNIFSVDDSNGSVVKFSSDGTYVTHFGSYSGLNAFSWPSNIAVDNDGAVYVTDCENGVKKFSNAGAFLYDFGTSTAFSCSSAITIDDDGNVYVADDDGYIEKFNEHGVHVLQIGEGTGSGNGELDWIEDLDIGSDGKLYVADNGNDRVQIFNADGTYASKFGSQGTTTGTFAYISGIALDAEDNIYVSDGNNVNVQKFDASGSYLSTFTGDGTMRFRNPNDVTITPDSKLLVSNNNYNYISVFSIQTPATPVITSVAATTSTSTASITWTTDIVGSSRVLYGLTSGYGSSTSEIDTSPRVTSHSVSISNLLPCVVYHYKVISISSTSGTASSSDQTFSTSCTGNATISSSVAVNANTATTTSLSLNTLTISVPPAFTSTSSYAHFQINKLENAAFTQAVSNPSGKSRAGPAVYHLVSIVGSSTRLTTFTAPITITFSYTPSDLVSVMENSLTGYRYDGSSWYELDSCSRDIVLRTVTCTTTSFSDFALFASPAPGGSSSGGGGGGYVVVNNTPYQIGAASISISTTTSSSTVIVPAYPQLSDPATTTNSLFFRNLYRGLRGEDVAILQREFSKMGNIYPEKLVTGYFGLLTYKATLRFQCLKGITCEGDEITTGWGVFGPKTRAVFENEAYTTSK